MKKHEHIPQYSASLIGQARRLRREMTDAERKLWSRLRRSQIGLKFRRQVPFGPYILDFFCVKAGLDVELDGSQHYTEKRIGKDRERDLFLQQQGLTVLRFSSRDALVNTDSVVEEIYSCVQERLAETKVESK